MITIEDCKAFCDAPSSHAEELSCHECVTMVEAYARAHDMALRVAGRRDDGTNPIR